MAKVLYQYMWAASSMSKFCVVKMDLEDETWSINGNNGIKS
jgi:hypothetical protein